MLLGALVGALARLQETSRNMSDFPEYFWTPFGVLSDVLSGLLSGVLSGVLSGMRAGVLSGLLLGLLLRLLWVALKGAL